MNWFPGVRKRNNSTKTIKKKLEGANSVVFEYFPISDFWDQ